MNMLFTVLLLLTAMPLCAMQKVPTVVDFDSISNFEKLSINQSPNFNNNENTSGKTTAPTTTTTVENTSPFRITSVSPNIGDDDIVDRLKDLDKQIQHDQKKLKQFMKKPKEERKRLGNVILQLNNAIQNNCDLRDSLENDLETQQKSIYLIRKIVQGIKEVRDNLIQTGLTGPTKSKKESLTKLVEEHQKLKKNYRDFFINSPSWVLLKNGLTLLIKVNEEIVKTTINAELSNDEYDNKPEDANLGRDVYFLKSAKEELIKRFDGLVDNLSKIIQGVYVVDYYYLENFFN